MTAEESALWNKIREYQIDDDTSVMTFTDRLMRENGWSMEYALRVIEEYKKFMLLLCVAPHPLTPSDQVDQVWHLHLLYTRSYWIDFCQDTLGRQIHHGPTRGGREEGDKYNDWYEKTMSLYLEIFNYTAPQDIWLPGEIRFREINFLRVNLHRNWVIKKPSFFVR